MFRMKLGKQTTCRDCGVTVARKYQLKGSPQRCRNCRNIFWKRNPEMSPRFKTGRCKDSNGYITVICTNHPSAHQNGRVFEHRLVMEKKIGRMLLKDEIVHHINGIRDDNRIENLVLCKSQKEHFQNHTNPDCRICGKKHYAKSLCHRHYQQWRRAGKPAKWIR